MGRAWPRRQARIGRLTPRAGRPSNRRMAAAIGLGTGPRRLGRLALNAVLPPRCLKCGAVVDAPGTLCAGCWAAMRFLAPPLCACCGYPFEFELGEGALCGACARDRPPYGRARAVLRYDDASKAVVLGFKHGDRTEGAPAYGRWLLRACAELIAAAELIGPVPLHCL